MTPYLTHALIPAGSDLTGLIARVAGRAGATLATGPYGVATELWFGSYPFFLAVDDGTLEHTELPGFREHILTSAGSDSERRSLYAAVVTLGGLLPDPQMEHFNDAVFLMKTIEALFPGAILFNPQSGERI